MSFHINNILSLRTFLTPKYKLTNSTTVKLWTHNPIDWVFVLFNLIFIFSVQFKVSPFIIMVSIILLYSSSNWNIRFTMNKSRNVRFNPLNLKFPRLGGGAWPPLGDSGGGRTLKPPLSATAVQWTQILDVNH